MRKPIEIYDHQENRFVTGEFRPLRQLDSGAELGYFESVDCANILAVMVLYPDGTYSIAERLYGELAQGSIACDVD